MRMYFRILVLAAMCARLWPAETAGSDLFLYRQGWLGGDAAYSIPLDAGTTVWLFGDTFVGDHRSANGMIHNSIAIRKCERTCEVSYWWSGMHTSHPDAFFRTPESNYFWPLDGFVRNGTLYVFLEEMRATPEGGAFGFDYKSVKLAVISNPAAAPEKWRISYRSVSEGNQVVPGVATAVAETDGAKWLYAFTLFRRSRSHPSVGLLRTSLDQVTPDVSQFPWQYLSSAVHWVKWAPSTSPADALQLLSGNITEMSVKFHPRSHSWVAVYPSPGGSFKTASYSRAAQVSGPWTTPQTLFAYPEMSSSDSRHTPSVFCAAKEHPELESDSELAITYACNSFKEPEILRDLRLYRPELVITHLPASPIPGESPHP